MGDVAVAVAVVVAFDILAVVAVVAFAAADDVVAAVADAVVVAAVVDTAAVVVDFPRDDPVKTVPTHLLSGGVRWAVHAPVQSSFGSKGLA